MKVIGGHGHEEYKKHFAKGQIPFATDVYIGEGPMGSCAHYNVLDDGTLTRKGIKYSPEDAIDGDFWRAIISQAPI